MPTAEGTIGFVYRLTAARPQDYIPHATLEVLNDWRRRLIAAGVIGQQADRYEGFGFGNISARAAEGEGFFVTASQTGGIAELTIHELPRIDAWNFDAFSLDATGDAAPSSESLTHAALYAADPSLGWIMHGHAPAIWDQHRALKLPTIDASVGYGTPDMARAVDDLVQRHPERPLLFATLGHEDGVFALGDAADTTGAILLDALARAEAGNTR